MSIVRPVAAPAMPVDNAAVHKHRERIPLIEQLYPAAVARKVKKAEVDREPKAKAAVDKEYFKLEEMPHPDGLGKGVWDKATPKEAQSVREDARRRKETVHFGMVAELCFEKGSELPAGDPLKVYKGRHVFLKKKTRLSIQHKKIANENRKT